MKLDGNLYFSISGLADRRGHNDDLSAGLTFDDEFVVETGKLEELIVIHLRAGRESEDYAQIVADDGIGLRPGSGFGQRLSERGHRSLA